MEKSDIKYAVDRIEENTIVLEDMGSSEIIEISKKDIDLDLHDGDILHYKDGIYSLDETAKQERLKIIAEKMNRLKRKDKES